MLTDQSTVRSTIFPTSAPIQPTGLSAFRFIIPTEKLASDPALSRFAPSLLRPTMRIVESRGKRIVMYPCRRGELLNLVCIHADGDSGGREESWDGSSSVAALTATFADFDAVFLRMFKLLADADIGLWQLRDRGPLDTWVAGCVGLLGDACHPMTPHQGQGASQAIEDGAALGVLFPLGTKPQDVPARLKLYEHVRKARAESIQMFSRNIAMGREPSDGVSSKFPSMLDGGWACAEDFFSCSDPDPGVYVRP